MSSRTDAALRELVTVSVEIDGDDVVSWVRDNYAPEDVFSVRVLGEWAEDNGYITEGV